MAAVHDVNLAVAAVVDGLREIGVNRHGAPDDRGPFIVQCAEIWPALSER